MEAFRLVGQRRRHTTDAGGEQVELGGDGLGGHGRLSGVGGVTYAEFRRVLPDRHYRARIQTRRSRPGWRLTSTAPADPSVNRQARFWPTRAEWNSVVARKEIKGRQGDHSYRGNEPIMKEWV